MTNQGKKFETQFVKAVPADYVKYVRVNDSTGMFGKNANLRFSNKNGFDFFLWQSKQLRLYCLELKTKKGKSISFERTKEEQGKKDIHYHQIKALTEWDKYDGTVCGFVIEFREIETTFFIHIKHFNELISVIPKKSFNWKDLQENNIPYFVIPQHKLKTNYKYDLELFLTNNNDVA